MINIYRVSTERYEWYTSVNISRILDLPEDLNGGNFPFSKRDHYARSLSKKQATLQTNGAILPFSSRRKIRLF